MSWTLKEGCITSKGANPGACAGASCSSWKCPWSLPGLCRVLGRGAHPQVGSFCCQAVGSAWLGRIVRQDLNLHSLLGHPGVMPGLGAPLAEGWGGGTVDYHCCLWAKPRRGDRRDTQMPFAAFFALFFGKVLVVPSTPGPSCQHPGALGAAKAMAVEQISGTTTVTDFYYKSRVPFLAEPELVLHVLQGSLSLQAPRQHMGQMELGSPEFSITIPRDCGDVRQPCKPAVIWRRFDNVPLSFNVTSPCVCSSVIERDIGQIWSVWLWLMLSLSWPSCH